MYYNKKSHSVCFAEDSLKKLFEEIPRKTFFEKILSSKYSPSELLADKNKLCEITDSFKMLNDKEDVEIFMSLYVLLNFYPKSKICFKLKPNIDIHKIQINSLEILKKSLNENDITDFGLWDGSGYRAFQMKTYKEKTNSDELFNFLKIKLLHYGNDLGDTNLLVILQGVGNIEGPFFQDVHKKLKELGLKGGGHILIYYNEENKFRVINTLYPDLGTTRLPYVKFNNFFE